MAQRRMFSLSIVDSDAFLEMPLSTQALYFHLSMRADDDGFVNNPKMLQRMIGASDDDLKLLIAKRFVLTFDSGIIVIKHWKMNNYIQKDRYKPTVYQEEYSCLETENNGAYTECIQNVYNLDTQYSVVKSSLELGKERDITTTSSMVAKDKHSTDDAVKTEREYYDWSEYTEEELNIPVPACATYPGVNMTVAELDVLFKCIPNQKAYETYLHKLQHYRDIKDQFSTVLKWAIEDGNYVDINER